LYIAQRRSGRERESKPSGFVGGFVHERAIGAVAPQEPPARRVLAHGGQLESWWQCASTVPVEVV
jgi:hypothetical protein